MITMTMNQITDYFQFCKWIKLEFIKDHRSFEFDFYFWHPDAFARKLKNEGYDQSFIKKIIDYLHRYKLDTKNLKLPKITYRDYNDLDDRDIVFSWDILRYKF